MREIERTSRFKRDDKREAKGRHRSTLDESLLDVLRPLVTDSPLPERYRDHALTGTWSGYRDCHVKPDLVLTNEKPDADTLRLIRLGSHSALGL
jgi:mRNA interferase YafQ